MITTCVWLTMRKAFYRKRRQRQRAGSMKHLKAAVQKQASESAHRIGRQILNRKLGETFLIPSLRPKYPSTSHLVKQEIGRVGKEIRRKPWKTLKSAYRLLRAK